MIDLTEEEEKIILKYREEKRERQFNEIKKRLCDHDWVFSCFTHKDTAYECKKCGSIKFE